MFAWMRRLPQLAFWPFSRRREEALRLRLLRDRIAHSRTWRGNLEQRLTAVENLIVKMQANCLRHSAQLSRLNRGLPLTLEETKRAFGIPQDSPTTAATPTISADTDIAQGTSPPADTFYEKKILVQSPPAVPTTTSVASSDLEGGTLFVSTEDT